MICERCSTCGTEVEVADSQVGTSIDCPHCGKTVTIRAGMTEVVSESSRVSSGMRSAPARGAWVPSRSPPQGPDELGRLAHYRVFRLVGEGGMGMVFEAEDLHLQRRVALKIMRPESAAQAIARERFVREARAMASIHSDH